MQGERLIKIQILLRPRRVVSLGEMVRELVGNDLNVVAISVLEPLSDTIVQSQSASRWYPLIDHLTV